MGLKVAAKWFNRSGVRAIVVQRGVFGHWVRPNADDMRSLLGVKVLPRDGMGERLIGGVRVYVAPLVPGWGKRWQHGRAAKCWQGLRVMAICECGQHVAVGRLHQHKCKSNNVAGEN